MNRAPASLALGAGLILALSACGVPDASKPDPDPATQDAGDDSGGPEETGADVETGESAVEGESGDTAADDSGDTALGETAAETGAGDSAGGETAVDDTAGDDTGARAWTDPWVQVSMAWGAAVVRSSSGVLTCWGDESDGNLGCPSGAYSEVSIGAVSACALDELGYPSCWGNTLDSYGDWHYGQVDPPTQTLRGLSVGAFQACALDDANAIVCWGLTEDEYRPPEGQFETIDLDEFAGCGVTSGGELACWGYLAGVGEFLNGRAAAWGAVAVGTLHVCALDLDGHPWCAGGRYGDTDDAPLMEVFTSLSAGDEATCGVTAGGRIRCWASHVLEDHYPVRTSIVEDDAPTDGGWAAVAVGSTVACGLRIDGTVECWGRVGEYRLVDEPEPPG